MSGSGDATPSLVNSWRRVCCVFGACAHFPARRRRSSLDQPRASLMSRGLGMQPGRGWSCRWWCPDHFRGVLPLSAGDCGLTSPSLTRDGHRHLGISTRDSTTRCTTRPPDCAEPERMKLPMHMASMPLEHPTTTCCRLHFPLIFKHLKTDNTAKMVPPPSDREGHGKPISSQGLSQSDIISRPFQSRMSWNPNPTSNKMHPIPATPLTLSATCCQASLPEPPQSPQSSSRSPAPPPHRRHPGAR